jgi:hypothetical protein
MIIALAGRRVDAVDAEVSRFPLSNILIIRERLRALFDERKADKLVCAAACGSDLLALSVAREMGIQYRIILPFERSRFRKTSVIDRPGDWGDLFDELCQEAEATGNLIVLDDATEDDKAYIAANSRIIEEALLLARQNIDEHNDESGQLRLSEGDAIVVIVWEGNSRGSDDVTASFADLGRAHGLSVVEVLTK